MITPTPLALAWLAARRAEALERAKRNAATDDDWLILQETPPPLASARRMRLRAMEGAR